MLNGQNKLYVKRKIAFTLAEVLITLGVIGVVAAMTLPTLIFNYQKKVVANRLKQTYSLIYQSIEKSKAEYGDSNIWEYDDLETYTKKYIFNNLKYEETDIPQNYSWKTKDGRIYRSISSISNYSNIKLSNGTFVFVDLSNNNNRLNVFTDIDGLGKNNILGRDIFLFEYKIESGRLWPYGRGLNRENLLKVCKSDKTQAVYSNLYCTALIETDNWEIKNDYPW